MTETTGPPTFEIPRLNSEETAARFGPTANEDKYKAKSQNLLTGDQADPSEEYELEGNKVEENLNDHIPEEGTDDYEYTEYSKTNNTNDQFVNALSESEGHRDILSEKLAPATAPPLNNLNSDMDPLSLSGTNKTPLVNYQQPGGSSNSHNRPHIIGSS